jgi:hypothetical protein
MGNNTIAIKTGDYVHFGSYNDEPILWVVLKEDEKGIMLFSVKNISMKPFDARGPFHSNDRQKYIYGSARWENSNIRQWLNSTDEKIDWIQNAPFKENIWRGENPYADEKGFLAEGNFSASDRLLIKEVVNETLQSAPNGGGAYATKDKMFFLSKAEYEDLAKGTKFEQAHMTAKAIEKSDFNYYGLLTTNSEWRYWLREPYPNNPHTVFLVIPGGMVVYDNSSAYGNVGVRPACYINPEAIVCSGGEGSEASPYVLTGSEIVKEARTVNEFGDPVDVSWYTDAAPSTGGTAANPYVIDSADKLRGLATIVNDLIDTFEGKFISMDRDLDISDYEWIPIGAWNTGEGTPDDSIMFCGSFDGNGHAISGLHIGTKDSYSSCFQFFGLFGIIGPNATVQNVSIKGEIYITSPAEPPVLLCAPIAGINRGRVISCHSDVLLNARSEFLLYAGGVVAVGYYHIKNCSSRGDINVEAKGHCNVGGIAAYNGIDSFIRNNFSLSNIYHKSENAPVTGGCIGSNAKNKTENCYSTGIINSTSNIFETPDPDGNMMPCGCAGVAGAIFCGGQPDMCYWSAETVKEFVIHDMNESYTPKDIRRMPVEEMRTDAFCALLNENVDALGDPELKKWVRSDDMNGGYPAFEQQ